MISLELPWPPSVNHYWGTRGKGRYIAAKGQAFRADVCRIVVEQNRQHINTGEVPPVFKQTGRLAVFVTVCPPDRRRRDLDNLHKAILDALAHAGCYDDDEQIDALAIMRDEVVKGGLVRVTICQASSPKATRFVDLVKG